MQNWNSRQLKQRFRPKKNIPHEWPVPRILNNIELANWFQTNEKLLNWLAAPGTNDDPGKHYCFRWIRKRVGHRLIESPKAKLKSIQRQILTGILDCIPVSNNAHGFCKDRNVKSFVADHVQRAVCLKMDLKQFFPSIRAGRVYGLFSSLGYPKPVARVLTGLCTAYASQTALKELGGMCTAGQQLHQIYSQRHLPQGAPTSPALSNLIAYRLDRRLNEFVEEAGGRYTRYADDILFSFEEQFASDRQCKNRLKRFANAVAAIAIEEGFEVNFRKTRIMFRAQRQMAAGLVINEIPNCSRAAFDQLKAILFNCVHHGPGSQNLDKDPRFQERLAGKVNWVRFVNESRGNKLLKLYEQIDW